MIGGPAGPRCPACGAEARSGARFCDSCGSSLPGPSVALSPADGTSVPGGGAATTGDELRPITALFADVVGSTALGERLGPDEVKALIGECVSRMSRAVEEYGGIIQAYAGDGICAYFGVPAAHEDDPERAARAALRIVDVVGEYGRDVEAAWGIQNFSVRVGINSGQAGVGQVGGADRQTVALGDTTNVAARLQSAAEPGTIAVGPETAKRLSESYALQSLGEIQVKGRDRAVPAYRLTGAREPGASPDVPPLVGREEEMARAGGLLTELQAGRGQILLLVGEAGIGKTRLLAELRAGVSGSVAWLEGRCLSYGGDQLSWPFVEMLRGWLGLQPGEPEVAVRMRLRAKLGGLFGPQADRVLPYLGRLLSVRLDPEFESRLAATTPEALAAETRRAYLEWIERLAERQPLVVALDDAHWADPSTRALAEDLLEVTDRAPLMVAAALRPDTASEGWALRLKALSEYQHRAEEVTLGPLSRESSLQLADAILPAGVLDEVIKEGMVLRAEGNPLYLEELLRSMVEGGGLDRGRSWTLTISTGQLLPSSLESLFVARIDRLPPGARSLAQVAAVIGRNFPVRVLDEVGESDDLQGDLAVLLRAGMVRELRRYPELECTFKHGLLQEAALSTLPKARQRELYGRVAAAFERLYSGSLEDHLEVLAFHYYRSDDDAKALQYLERAGSKAAGLNAADQATELWIRAQKVASKLGDDEAGRRLAERLSAVRPEQG